MITEKELIKKYPILTLEEPTRNLSEKYIHRPSIEIVRDISKLGWDPIEVDMRGKGESDFCKHSVTFQKSNLNFTIIEDDLITPLVTFVNSYDGLYTLKLYSEFYRRISSTIFTIPIQDSKGETWLYQKIPHTSYSQEYLQKSLADILNGAFQSVKQAHKLVKHKLTKEQQRKFARAAFKLREGKRKDSPTEDIIDTLLTPTRPQDEGDNAWAVMNRVQEKIIKGFTVEGEITKGARGKEIQSLKKIRYLGSFERKLDINLNIFLIMQRIIQHDIKQAPFNSVKDFINFKSRKYEIIKMVIWEQKTRIE